MADVALLRQHDSVAAAKGLAVFDLDRTLVRGSSLARLARAMAEARLLRRTELAGHLTKEAVFAARGFGPASISRLRTALLKAAAGCEQAPLMEVVDRVAPTIADGVIPAARWLLDRHLRAGDDVVILSSSPQELVAAIAASIDRSIVGIGTVAEVRDGRYTGLLAAPFCHGEGKLERLHQEVPLVDLSVATAYADSASDIPVLAACANAVAVNPDRPLRTAASARGWQIMDLA